MRKGLLILVSASLIGGCAPSFEPNSSQQRRFQPARQAEKLGDYATALEIYEDAAEDGSVYAQYRVAKMYESGRGTEQDYAQAARWYAAASEAGTPAGHARSGQTARAGPGRRAGRRGGAGAVSRVGGSRRSRGRLQGRAVPGTGAGDRA